MLTLVPEEIERYAERHTTPENDLLRSLVCETIDRTDDPRMQVGVLEGTYLKLLARATAAKRVLEIGTFTGYSALMLAEGVGPDGEVITCDISREFTDIARRFWERSPHGKKIELRLGRAIESIQSVPPPLDLVFIDADKRSYIDYWEACLPKVRSGGLILADNVLWSGRVLDPKEPDDRAIAAFNDHVRGDDRVDLVMLTIRDGVTMACKR